MSELSRKRRIIRKGTKNCTECYRRKVRCTFASPTSTACENCTQRKSTCVSPEFEQRSGSGDDQPVAGLEARLIKVEQSLQRLLDRDGDNPTINASHQAEETLRFRGDGPLASGGHAVPSPLPSPNFVLDSSASIDKYTGTSKHLVAAWPEESDLSYVYDLPASLSTHLQMRSSASPRETSSQDPSAVRTMLRLPPPGSHPTIIAHTLLCLASLLQKALAMVDLHAEVQQRFERVMLTITSTVTRFVTSDDELTSSVEGVECIMMEALIQNHAGKLHRAWRTVRRAVTAAQVLGLHRNVALHAKSFLDEKTRSLFDLEKFRFHIVCIDRYLSITLGLPYASNLPYATTSEQLTDFAPIDRMARLQCIITERLLDRPKDGINGISDIDQLLLEAAAQMPHQWWLIPDSRCGSASDLDQVTEFARFNYQLSHYHLLLRLYLPYVFQPHQNADHRHGKQIALGASREILSRYLALRSWNKSRYYCRGMDFLALIALTVLCVVHIDSRAQQASPSSLIHAPNELAHCHLVDRGMMHRALEVIRGVDRDETASKLSQIMQSLLDIEAEAAVGKEYSATAVYNGDGTTEYQSEVLDEGRKLQLRIPYFGIITLQQTSALDLTNGFSASNDFLFADQSLLQTGTDWDDGNLHHQVATYDDWTLQSVNQALFQDLFGGSYNC